MFDGKGFSLFEYAAFPLTFPLPDFGTLASALNCNAQEQPELKKLKPLSFPGTLKRVNNKI